MGWIPAILLATVISVTIVGVMFVLPLYLGMQFANAWEEYYHGRRKRKIQNASARCYSDEYPEFRDEKGRSVS